MYTKHENLFAIYMHSQCACKTWLDFDIINQLQFTDL